MKTFYDTRRSMFILVLVLCLFSGMMFLGCSDEDTNDIIPDLVLSSNSLDFGSVQVGMSAVHSLTVRNLSNAAITVERVTLTDESFEVGGYYYYTTGQLIELEVPFTVAETEAKALYIKFTPANPQTYSGTLVVEGKDADSNIEKNLVDLSGTGITPPEM